MAKKSRGGRGKHEKKEDITLSCEGNVAWLTWEDDRGEGEKKGLALAEEEGGGGNVAISRGGKIRKDEGGILCQQEEANWRLNGPQEEGSKRKGPFFLTRGKGERADALVEKTELGGFGARGDALASAGNGGEWRPLIA